MKMWGSECIFSDVSSLPGNSGANSLSPGEKEYTVSVGFKPPGTTV
jgi:hypothetical protein